MLNENDFTTRWLRIFFAIRLNWKSSEMKTMLREVYLMILMNYTKGNLEKNEQIERIEEMRQLRLQIHGHTWTDDFNKIQEKLNTEMVAQSPEEKRKQGITPN
jgi:hypothetical protein